MFSGIVECLGEIIEIQSRGQNKIFRVSSPISHESYIDQSISHNGVCLTVIEKAGNWHKVEAVFETLEKSNLSLLNEGSKINLERSVKFDSMMDGHLVQGHVDSTIECTAVDSVEGSWYYSFNFLEKYANLLVNKGSVSIDGVSLTVIEPNQNSFRVAIIPYTYQNTNFQYIQKGTICNIEFDIIGKYVQRYLDLTSK